MMCSKIQLLPCHVTLDALPGTCLTGSWLLRVAFEQRYSKHLEYVTVPVSGGSFHIPLVYHLLELSSTDNVMISYEGEEKKRD